MGAVAEAVQLDDADLVAVALDQPRRVATGTSMRSRLTFTVRGRSLARA